MHMYFIPKPAPLTLTPAFGDAAMLLDPAAKAVRGNVFRTHRKKLYVSIAAVLGLSISQTAMADSASSSCSLSGDGLTYTCSGQYSPYEQSRLNYENVVFNMTGSWGTKPDITGVGIYANGGSRIAQNNVTITTNGITADAIRTRGTATVTIPGKLIIQAKGLSGDGINATIDGAATVTVGDNAEIYSRGGIAVRANLSMGSLNTITLGENANLQTISTGTNGSSASGYAVYAGNRNNETVGLPQGTAKITIGNNSTISTSGKNAHAVYANKGGAIYLGSTNISTTNTGSHGLSSESGSISYSSNSRTYDGGKIYLSGDTRINVVDPTPSGTNKSYAVYSSGTNALIQSNNPGKYTISGDMRAQNGGTINLKMIDNSIFTGNTSIDGTNSALNLSINGSNSVWQMNRDSNLTNLVLIGYPNVKLGNQSTPLDATTNPGITLTIGDLSGSGTFYLRTRIDGPGNNGFTMQNYGDLINVTGTSTGNHHITVNDSNTGGATVDGSERLRIVQTADGGATFALTSSVDIGPYSYNLAQGDAAFGESGNDWYLSNPSQISPPPDPGNPDPNPGPGPTPPQTKPPLNNSAGNSANMLNINYLLNYVENQTLLQRMGELRRGESIAQGWVRGYGGKLNSFAGQGLSGFSMDYSGMQFGIDRHFNRDAGQLYLGAMAGFTSASPNYRKGSGDNTSYHVGVYGSYQTVSGLYVDAIAKYMQVDNSYDTVTSGGNPVKGDGNTRGYALGVEIGKRFYLSERPDAGWYLEPQAQLTYSHQNSATIGSSNGLSTRLNSYDSTIGRAGVIVGYSLAGGSNPVDVYFKSEVLSEFSGNAGYVFNNTERWKYDFKGTWWNNGIGVNAQLAKRHNLYADMNYASGSKFNQMQVNIGYRYMF